MSVISTTIKLWLSVPGNPPIWQCALVAWCVKTYQPKKNVMGSVELEDQVE